MVEGMQRLCELLRNGGRLEDSTTLSIQRPSQEPATELISVDPFNEAFVRIACRAPAMFPCVSPWDTEGFLQHGLNADAAFETCSPWDASFPQFEEEFVCFSPFDEDFPRIVKPEFVWTNMEGMVRVNSRHSHHSLRSRMRPKHKVRRTLHWLNKYGAEARVRRRLLKNMCRHIPLGLRFPSPGFKPPFEAVSPFDVRFPFSGRAPKAMKNISPAIKLFLAPAASPRLPTISETLPGLLPFPAISPIAARMRSAQAMALGWNWPPTSHLNGPILRTNDFRMFC